MATNWICERWEHLKALGGYGVFGKLVGGFWGLYGVAAMAREESTTVKAQLGQAGMIDWALSIPVSWWLVVALAIGLAWVFESSYWQSRGLRDEVGDLTLKLFNGAKRQAAIDGLWTLRAEGIKIRNEPVKLPDFPDYHTRWHDWRARVWAEANIVNPNLKNWLEYLDQLGPPPQRNDPYCSQEHKRLVEAGSEILVRLQRFLEGEIR